MNVNKQILMMTAAVVIAATTIFAGCKKDDDKVKVTGVEVNPSAVMFYVNNNQMLDAFFTPSSVLEYDVVWTSSNPDITVEQLGSMSSSVIVKSNAIGESIVTCTTKNGHSAFSTVIVNPVLNDDDYATLLPMFYFGNLTMGEENVGENSLITTKYHSNNKIILAIDEKFKVPQMGNAEVPMKVDCVADVTKVDGGYKAVGETTTELSGLTLSVKIEAIFDGIKNVDMNISVGNVPIMGDIVINFKGKGVWKVEID